MLLRVRFLNKKSDVPIGWMYAILQQKKFIVPIGRAYLAANKLKHRPVF